MTVLVKFHIRYKKYCTNISSFVAVVKPVYNILVYDKMWVIRW